MSVNNFTIFPAIDLRGGNVVRLQYGDPNKQTIFDADPVAAAFRWIEAGAKWLHVVNLDGAFGEKGDANWRALKRLTVLPVRVQFGGGVRSRHDIDRALAIGVKRIVLGTISAENPTFVGEMVQRYGAERIIVGLDARDGIIKTRGWQEDSGVSAIDLGKQMCAMGVQTVLHTDIGRDGVLTGVNWQASQQLSAETDLQVIASGGVATLDDITACQAANGVCGVITGRAIYDGRLDLKEAILSVNGDA